MKPCASVLIGCLVFATLATRLEPLAKKGDLTESVGALASQGQFDSALSLVKKEIDTNPNSAEGLLLLGKLEPQASHATLTWQKLNAAGKTSDEDAEALFRIGQYEYAAGVYQKAIPQFREYLQRYPDGQDANPVAYWMANACLQYALSPPGHEDYLDTALRALARINDPTKKPNYYQGISLEVMSRIFLAQGKARKADSLLSQSVGHAPADAKAPQVLLLAQTRRALSLPYMDLLDTLKKNFPHSVEQAYVEKLKGKIPNPSGLNAFALKQNDATSSNLRDTASGSKTGLPVQTLTEQTSQGPSWQGNWGIQTGAFTQETNAQDMIRELKRKGISAKTKPIERGGKHLIQVLVGQFESATTAEDYASHMLKPHEILYQVVKLK